VVWEGKRGVGGGECGGFNRKDSSKNTNNGKVKGKKKEGKPKQKEIP